MIQMVGPPPALAREFLSFSARLTAAVGSSRQLVADRRFLFSVGRCVAPVGSKAADAWRWLARPFANSVCRQFLIHLSRRKRRKAARVNVWMNGECVA